MNIRNAQSKDTDRILYLLRQVLEIHAEIRPDIFISGTTKYTHEDLIGLFEDETRRTYVAVDENDEVLGYAMCELKEYKDSNNIHPHKEIYIDDLCVDSAARGQGIGKDLFLYVKEQARIMDCYNITLNVWEGNDTAKAFYDSMGMKPKSTKMEMLA